MQNPVNEPRIPPVRRIVVAIACLVPLVAVWGVVAVEGLNWLWPYPLILPENISWNHQTFDRQAGCHSLGWYDHNFRLSGADRAIRAGSVSSVLLLGSAPVYAPVLSPPGGIDGYVFVGTGTCDVMYTSEEMG
jgi:hypothetical protein